MEINTKWVSNCTKQGSRGRGTPVAVRASGAALREEGMDIRRYRGK